MKKTLVSMMAAAAVVASVSAAQAQVATPFSLEVRGGLALPSGDLSDEDVTSGVGLNVNGQFRFNPMFSAYAEFNWAQFGVEDSDDVDVTDSGFGGGVMAHFNAGSMTPFLKAGVVVHQLSVDELDAEDEQLGFRVGGGLAFPLGNRLSVTPGVTYTQYGIKDADFDVSHIDIDVGLKINL
jgi:opacity protein-like surface antigen